MKNTARFIIWQITFFFRLLLLRPHTTSPWKPCGVHSLRHWWQPSCCAQSTPSATSTLYSSMSSTTSPGSSLSWCRSSSWELLGWVAQYMMKSQIFNYWEWALFVSGLTSMNFGRGFEKLTIVNGSLMLVFDMIMVFKS